MGADNLNPDYTIGTHPVVKKPSVCVITGACRSGKTTLGNLLATAEHVENSEEPWTPMMLPVLSGLGLLDKRIALQMFNASIGELINDTVLLRRANFRPGELSSIYRQKDAAEIFERLTNFRTRDDVERYLSQKDPLFILNLAETSPFLEFFEESVLISKTIVLFRSVNSVAGDIAQKKWLSDEHLSSPKNRILYRKAMNKGKVLYLPWWVEEADDEYFVRLDESHRAVYYWCQLSGKTLDSLERVADKEAVSLMSYEELTKEPDRVFERFASMHSLKKTPLTELALTEIEQFKHPGPVTFEITDRHLNDRVAYLNSFLSEFLENR